MTKSMLKEQQQQDVLIRKEIIAQKKREAKKYLRLIKYLNKIIRIENTKKIMS